MIAAGRFAAPGVVHRAAAAKINLYLHVVGRRADGYHELDSLVAFAAVHDTVSAAPADDLSLTFAGPFAGALAVGDKENNLVLRAARALAAAAGIAPRARAALRLIKRLPVASGIGGGSADAAAALRALGAMWGVTLDEGALGALALGLGADVPICLRGRTAYLGGIGERIDPAPALPQTPIVLVNPLRALATPAVFTARHGPFSVPERLAGGARDTAHLARELADRRNDLTTPAIELMPGIAVILDRLARLPGCLLARMSGSGATCFALFARAESAAAAADTLRGENPGWWVCDSVLVGATEAIAPSLEPD